MAYENFGSLRAGDFDPLLSPYNAVVDHEFGAIDLRALANTSTPVMNASPGFPEYHKELIDTLISRPGLTETRLGLLPVEIVREYERRFLTTFDGLQSLGILIGQVNDERQLSAVSACMETTILSLNDCLQVVGDRPVKGGRHSRFYFTGEIGRPEKIHRRLFANHVFKGVIDRVEAVVKPGSDDEHGQFVCFVLRTGDESQLTTVRPPLSLVKGARTDTFPEQWIPIGGVNLDFEPVVLRRADKVA